MKRFYGSELSIRQFIYDITKKGIYTRSTMATFISSVHKFATCRRRRRINVAYVY